MDRVKKKPLKTRHKTSVPEDEISNKDRQIVVWVDQEEKVVCGLTKHTTSEDVVEALLEENKVSATNHYVLFGIYKEYCIMETWKNLKRILPPSLKMLKLLKSWGAEQSNVSFVLMKKCTMYPCSVWWTSQKSITCDYCKSQDNAFHVQNFPLPIRKKIVRKAFRKLEKMKKNMVSPKENNIQQLIYILSSQDTIIKQQMDKMKQLDKQLEVYDSCQQKLEKLGCSGDVPNAVSSVNADDLGLSTFDRFLEIYNLENVIHIQEELNHQHSLIRNLSEEIKVDMSSMCEQDDEDFVAEGHTDMVTSIKQEIEESLQVGLRLHHLYSYIQKEIQYNELILLHKKKEYEILKDEINSVCASDSNTSLCFKPTQYMSSDACGSREMHKISAVMSRVDIQNDTDSDTGISSTHSQDSEAIQ
ncbi:ras association domain-containing protein 9 [Engystomops pustulosus]|uniref:ras association domain-containing protein 9 n=1 Tax=Engystomops pustulosus TaxID=76066 RepID=UPI003AFB0BF1